ncbi:MAG: aspartate-semialdehyde dehydrogenase [Acidobacteria bacterium]|nr:aspartate-semialdehyde dehydrogenase [Acidobacteriota bacterium]
MNLKNSIHTSLSKGNRIPVAVLGATGMVGQVFMWMLENHPRFRVTAICAGKSRNGKTYRESTKWQLPVPFPESLGEMSLQNLKAVAAAPPAIVFSALPAEIAGEIEPELAGYGAAVFSNASAMRGKENVPILIPEVNPDDLNRIDHQPWGNNGFVVTNANCATTGPAVALAPLRKFGIREVFVSTYQSVSGAGYPGIPYMDISGNVVPFIENEEEKIQRELTAILHLDIPIFPFCVRVPVRFGHLETVWLDLKETVDVDDIREAWGQFRSPTGLPSLPDSPVQYLAVPNQPQPALSFTGTPPGMTVFSGGLKKQGNRIGFTLLVNNIVKGAAGGSIANAELFVRQAEKRLRKDRESDRTHRRGSRH